MKYFWLILMAYSCGYVEAEREPVHTAQLSIDGFEDFVYDFQDDSEIYSEHRIQIDDLIVVFADIEQPSDRIILAQCIITTNQTPTNQTPTIVVDPDYWRQRSYLGKKTLMYHELGHCVLRRGHVDDIDSLMNPYVTSGLEFDDNRDYYLTELFNLSVRDTLLRLTHDGCNH